MNPLVGYLSIAAVVLSTVLIGFFGLRISRTTGDFYVASRTVQPWWNASAIGGEYLSAASVLGIAGLILLRGEAALWFPIGYTAGYLMLLLFVAAPLRRSGAYTIPDFTQARLESLAVRRVTSVLVIVIGWFYIVPQLQGAALTVGITTGLPRWSGAVAVAVIVGVVVAAGGMRSITFVQAFQFWLKLTALAIPIVVLLFVVRGDTGALPTEVALPLPVAPGPADSYLTGSLLFALLLGTMGLPHVLVRFYTNPDGRAARRTTLIVLGLLSVFYLFPTMFGILGRFFAPDLATTGEADALVLLLPEPPAARTGRRPAHGAGDRGGLRRVPVDIVGTRRLPRGRRVARPARRIGARVPGRRDRLGPRAARRRATHRAVGPRRQRRTRLRVHRVDAVPRAAARHLVARPHRARRDRRHGDRGAHLRRVDPDRAVDRCRDARALPRPTGGVDGAARDRRRDRRVPRGSRAHPARCRPLSRAAAHPRAGA